MVKFCDIDRLRMCLEVSNDAAKVQEIHTMYYVSIFDSVIGFTNYIVIFFINSHPALTTLTQRRQTRGSQRTDTTAP